MVYFVNIIFFLDYTLYYKDEYGPWSEITLPKSAEKEYTLSGLREGTRYQLYMRVTSDAGDSDPSDILTVRTEGGGKTLNVRNCFTFCHPIL